MCICYYIFGILMWISHVSLSNCPSCQLLYTFGVHSLSWFHFLYPSLCDKGGQWIVTGLWLSSVFSTNWSDFHDITDILLKVVFKTQDQTINTMLFVCLVKMWNYQNNHKIGYHKMKNNTTLLKQIQNHIAKS